MIDRIQTIDRLLDIASGYYGGESHVSINEIITLIQDLSLPSLHSLNLNNLPEPPKDDYCPYEFDDHRNKVWHYQQEFFHEILSCIDNISDENISKIERDVRKNKCIEALINWEESLEKYGKYFRKQSFKVL